jgi:hypothetical protein
MTTYTGTVIVRGQEFEVRYDPNTYRGEDYSARVNDKYIKSSTDAGLISAIGAELRKADVTVDVEFIDPENGWRGTTKKIHAGSKRPIISWANGRRSTDLDPQYPLNPTTDVAELKRLRQVVRDAQLGLEDFLKANRLKDADGKDHYRLSNLIKSEQARIAAEQEAAAQLEGVTPVELDA